jgi:hypothetical protein
MFDISTTEGQPSYRFSGHETFACRYAWLPKAYRAIAADASCWFPRRTEPVRQIISIEN